ncbi:protein TRANSPARENT TESTA 9 isoform X1 [Cannabis sativa]|uniref:protein TRANSPARENT TESTA 9 isoform X1 n=1 Tax=Cannabis sativa TaxID=3483 RepID=UPI0029CA7304|nr:protein TRANSPARENT TESTA 9 isoform X1 [Cannabis sativa]
MWFFSGRSRNRFSLDNLRSNGSSGYRSLTDQLVKVQIVNEVNKDFVIEAIRSIAELITYGDQHDDATFFELFMEKQVMGEFVRILKITRTLAVSLQLLQTVSILIQNLENEHALYYLFSNEYMNYLITYSFDFRNHDLLSYYISFLRAISRKLDKNTISLLVKTENDEVVSFPLYVEAIRFAFHEESMIRTAVRNLTLNIYIVGDDCVNRYVTSAPHADYFLNLVTFLQKQCIDLTQLVSYALKSPTEEITSSIFAAVDEIEDSLYYFSDVMSAGIPDVGRLMTDNLLQLLIFPILVPSLTIKAVNDMRSGIVTSLYLLCCILRIVKTKDLANVIAAALLCPLEAFISQSLAKTNGYMPAHECSHDIKVDAISSNFDDSNSSGTSQTHPVDFVENGCDYSRLALRETLLYYVTSGDDVQVLGSLCVLATLLQTKELDESMLDALGILPQRKQHKRLLLEALVGEGPSEEQLFSLESNSMRENIGSELDRYLLKLKEKYGVECSFRDVASPHVHRFQVLDALVSLFCRSNISAETLWEGGWLLRQLLSYSEAEFKSDHLKLLNESYKHCAAAMLQEVRGVWPDLLLSVLCDEWKKCKRAIEASSPRKQPKSILLSSQKSTEGLGESTVSAGERMCELVKVFVLLYQLQTFSLGKALPDQPPINPPVHVYENVRAKTAAVDSLGPKAGSELKLVDAIPCRIAFERGKERHFFFLPISRGMSGWVVLAEELPLKRSYGVVRIAAPLAGSNPRIDSKHSRWLHLRIRPSTLPSADLSKSGVSGQTKTKALVDGRWTLAFKDEESCKCALSMILEEMSVQVEEVERRLKPLLDIKTNSVHNSNEPESESSYTTPSNSL